MSGPPLTTIIGGPLSPYVRKVLAVCELKGVAYHIDPIVPFFGGDRFGEISPLRRIPVLIDDIVTLSDSSVICQYLEDRYPSPRVYPEDIAHRAEARWIEEYADTRMGDVFIWKVFNEACIKPAIWGSPRDVAAIGRAVSDDLPPVMDYLEQCAPESGFKFGAISIADISVAVFFRNLAWSRAAPEATRWPRTMAWVGRVAEVTALKRLSVAGDQLLRVPPAEAGEAMSRIGFTVAEESMAGPAPQRGPMTV